MSRPYRPEFRARAIALVRAGEQVKQTAYELDISAGCLHQWLKQDRIDRGELAVDEEPGVGPGAIAVDEHTPMLRRGRQEAVHQHLVDGCLVKP